MVRRNNHNSKDATIRSVRAALANYQAAHPAAQVEAKRQNSVSIRIRIIDPDFQGIDLVDRDTHLWQILDGLPESAQSQITMLLLLTPREAKTSFANLEFEHPVESRR